VGETHDVSIAFSHTEAVSEGTYTFYLRVTSTNYPTTDISDIYTGTFDENNEAIQGINGAKVKVQNVKNQGLKAVEIIA